MAAGAFTFGPFRLDARTKELQRGGVPVAIGVRDADLLLLLVARAGTLLSRDEIVHLVWSDAAVTDNSVEQAISNLRRLLDGPAGQRCIRTERGRGYRFVAPVEHTLHRESDAAIDALLAPHRAWLDGRRALETLEGAEIRRALEIFTHVIEDVPAQASAHVGLANACVLQFETTRADAVPDREALDRAVTHAREACRLDPEYGEAWATLGFVLERAGRRPDALAALRRAVMLEPDNWRHHLRLAYAGWGEERLRSADRARTLLPGLGLAHWLAATVHIARQAFGDAGRELAAGLDAQSRQAGEVRRFSAVALHWLSGLLHLREGDEAGAMAAFERELAAEANGHLYARECCANTWCAVAALHLRQGRTDAAADAFSQAIARVAAHPTARAGLAHLLGGGTPGAAARLAGADRPDGIDAALIAAVTLTLDGRSEEAAGIVERALAVAESGPGGWTLPIDPFLRVWEAPAGWNRALALLRIRAA